MSSRIGMIVSWNSKGCVANRSDAIEEYKNLKLHTFVPKFPQTGTKHIVKQLVDEGTLLSIGVSDDRESFAIVEEYRDPDLVDWHGTLVDAVTLFKDGTVVVRNNPELESKINTTIAEAENYILGPEIGRIICTTLENDANAVRIRQGVLWIPDYEWGTLNKIEDIWYDLAEGIYFTELQLDHTSSNTVDTLVRLCRESINTKLTLCEIHVMNDMLRTRKNPPNHRGLLNKKGKLKVIEYQAKLYAEELGEPPYLDFQDRFEKCRKTIAKMEAMVK